MSDIKWYDYQRAVWDSKVPSPHRLTLLALAFHASAEGECFPGNGKLAGEILATDRTVRHHTEDLERHGLIHKVPRPGRSSVYQLDGVAIVNWGGGSLAAWRNRPKRATPETGLPTSHVQHVADTPEMGLPGRVETGLPDRGGNLVSDITTRVNNPWTTSNRQNEGESVTKGDSPQRPCDRCSGSPAKLDNRSGSRLCKACAPYLHPVPDFTDVPSVPDHVPAHRVAGTSATASRMGSRLGSAPIDPAKRGRIKFMVRQERTKERAKGRTDLLDNVPRFAELYAA